MKKSSIRQHEAVYQVVEPGAVNPPPVSVKDWLVTILVMIIPVVNIIMMLVWAFSRSTNPSKSNYFKAQLLLFVVGLVLWLVLFVFLGIGSTLSANT